MESKLKLKSGTRKTLVSLAEGNKMYVPVWGIGTDFTTGSWTKDEFEAHEIRDSRHCLSDIILFVAPASKIH